MTAASLNSEQITNPQQVHRSEENNFTQTDTNSDKIPGKLEMFYLYKDPVLPGATGISEEELQLASLSIWISTLSHMLLNAAVRDYKPGAGRSRLMVKQ